MIFKRIKINNIRSYENAEINFPSGSVLLSGDIGSGKTSILLAIEFALFGLQPGQKGASLLKSNENEGSVELEFEIEGQNIIVKRILKRKKSVTQDSAFVTVNGITEEKATTELKNFVLTSLNYPLEFAKKTNLLYRFTVYTPQEQMKQIILEDPEMRLNTLRHVFGVDKYKRIKENTSIITGKIRELSRLKQGQIADFEPLKLSLEKRKTDLITIKGRLPDLEKNISEVLEIINTRKADLNNIKKQIDEKRDLENEVQKTNLLLITKEDQIKNIGLEISNLKKKLEDATKSFNQTDLEMVMANLTTKKISKQNINDEITTLSTRISTLISKTLDLTKLKEKISKLKTCPTCLQFVTDNHKHSILDKTESEILNIENEKSIFTVDREKKDILIKNLETEILDLEQKKNNLQELKIKLETLEQDKHKSVELEKQETTFKNDIKLLDQQIIRLKETISKMKPLDVMMETKEQELQELISRERALEIRKAETIKEIELGSKEIEIIEKDIIAKEKIKNELIHITDLENWLSSEFLELISVVEKNVMIKLRNEFSTLFNEWFSILVPDTFLVKLDDNFTPVIEQQDFELDYNFLSGGERTAIALAYRLALNQTINSLLSEIKTKGLVILDEPTEGFSQQQLDKMRDVLDQLEVNQLILVSHDQKIESFVDSIIKLDKSTGNSVIVD